VIATPEVLAGIPALPVAVAKVLEETGRDEPDPRVITRAIESDAGLAAKMLSLVNSPYYGLNGTVSSLSQAVMIVGMRQVRNVALAVGALRSIPGIPPQIVNAFLDRAMTTAKTSRSIGTKAGFSTQDADTAHIGGLLRGVGSLVAMRMGVQRPSDADLVSLARMVLEYWKLPAPIVTAVGNSAGPFNPGFPATPAYAVHAASLVICGRSGDVHPEALASLKMSPGDLAFYDPLVKS
jgi:hypothetical protein